MRRDGRKEKERIRRLSGRMRTGTTLMLYLVTVDDMLVGAAFTTVITLLSCAA